MSEVVHRTMLEAGYDPDAGGGRWVTGLAAGIDGMLLGAARLLIDFTIMPPPDEADTLRRQAAFYRSDELTDDPRKFFPFLRQPVPAPDASLAHVGDQTTERERLEMRFKSYYRPFNPDQRADYARQMENQTVHAEVWLHPGERVRGSVIALHGFGMGYPRIDAPTLMASSLFKMGLNVALMALPYHGARTPHGTRFSGQLFASPDVAQLNEAMGQSIHDVAALASWLRERTKGPVGLIGLSLGGYVTALAASLVEDLDFAVPMVAPVCFGDLAYRFMADSRRYREQPGARLEYEEFREIYRVHCPLSHRLHINPDRVLIVAGRGDRIVPVEHPLWLWEHWDRPRIHWFRGSHLAPFGRARTLATIRGFLYGLGVV